MCPPQSPTRMTKTSILKLSGAFHWRKTSRIRFCAFSYSAGEPCERSSQLIMYFIDSPRLEMKSRNGVLADNSIGGQYRGCWWLWCTQSRYAGAFLRRRGDAQPDQTVERGDVG